MDELEGLLAEWSINDYEQLPSFHEYEAQRIHRHTVGHSSVVANGSRSLVQALCYASDTGSKITSILAQNCGVAFLATDPALSSLLELSVRNVRSLSFQGDLVSNDTFTRDGGKVKLHRLENRQRELRRAIVSGLLGQFMSSAVELEELDVDLQCHEMSSLHVEESDLPNFIGNYRWSKLRWLKLRGIWTSEDELLDLVYRHRGSLNYLEIGDVVLKKGTWRSFFEKLKALITNSFITVERFQLGGGCLASWAVDRLGGQRWELDSPVSLGKSLRDSLVEFIFRNGAFPLLHEIGYSPAVSSTSTQRRLSFG
jgi:hypothetical protein